MLSVRQAFNRSYFWTRNGWRLYSISYPRAGDKVVVALSGGVDSSVAAKLLADQNYDLSAVYMRNWDTADESGTERTACSWKKEWEDVQKLCHRLNLPVELIDLSVEYWVRVFEPALNDWQNGVTPNPDVWCNREIKFGALMTRCAKLVQGAWLATGHYADIQWHEEHSGIPRPKLMRARDRHKDQTYYLSSIPEASLQKVIYPLASLTKAEVRDIARRAGLPSAHKEESMGLCFVGEKRKFASFLSNYLPPKPGPIIHHLTGANLGTHTGLWQYTIGQGAKLPGMRERFFVAEKDVDSNILRLVPGSDPTTLRAKALHSDDWRWIWTDSPPAMVTLEEGFRASVQFRHKMKDIFESPSSPDFNHTRITFQEPQLAAAPGQVAVLWDGNWCLGCGTISRTE